MKTFGDSGRSFAAQPPGNPGIKTLGSLQLPSATAPTTRGAGVADERGRESEVDSGGGVEPRGCADGQVEVGGTEVIEQPAARQRAPMMGRRRKASSTRADQSQTDPSRVAPS
jgi:hypothetical protein